MDFFTAKQRFGRIPIEEFKAMTLCSEYYIKHFFPDDMLFQCLTNSLEIFFLLNLIYFCYVLL